MKIFELKCPTCGGSLKVDGSKKPRFITCDHCGGQLYVDEEKIEHTVNNYHVYHNAPEPGSNFTSRTAAAVMLILGTLVLLAAITAGGRSSKRTTGTGSTYAPAYTAGTSTVTATAAAAPKSRIYTELVESVFGKPADEVTESDLAAIKSLKINTGLDNTSVIYSLDDPCTTEAPEFHTLRIQGNDWTKTDIYAFTGLTSLELGNSLPKNVDLDKFPHLRAITAERIELEDLASMLTAPEQLIELSVADITSLEAISSFLNLERLTLDDAAVSSLKPLVTLKNLKALTVIDSEDSDSGIQIGEKKERITDYNAISMLKNLEFLSLKSDLIKDFSFIKELPVLTALELNDLAIISLEPLTSVSGLTRLTLTRNNKLQNYDPVGNLSGLKELAINKLTSQTDPDLSGLTELEVLDINGFMSVASLKNLPHLKDLTISGSNLDSADVLATLKSVERLTLCSVWTSHSKLRSLDFTNGMTSLKYADFYGRQSSYLMQRSLTYALEVYGDISAILNHEGLEELYLDNGQFEIKFDRLTENPTLKTLSMNKVTLEKDFYVEYNGIITSTWYDDVNFTDHLDFLSNYPNLEYLSVSSNQLADISFVTVLPALTTLILKDNYVTDLAPLQHAEHLTFLNVTDNPISNFDILGDGITVVK